MRNKIIAGLMFLIFVLTACGNGTTQATATVEPTNTVPPTNTPEPTYTPEPVQITVIETVVVEVPVKETNCGTINDGIQNEYPLVSADDIDMSVVIIDMPKLGCSGYILLETTKVGHMFNRTLGKKISIWIDPSWERLLIRELPEGVMGYTGEDPLARYVPAFEYLSNHELGEGAFSKDVERYSGIPYFEITFIAVTNAGPFVGLTLRDNVNSK